ncbi:MAG: zf-HC2 domain-containing protein [Gammaproteobacteria bacterium]|nr:zf-HC2 domain-containing protein [Gammaproteobacteria bacterium]MBU1654838.1 zf-HC2 domain-containing protein [Gammaproteobacteria bacterium]MBU1961105.1 zf-HC2 domain-containing protein [Gammaproteobacteria bacterium]
MLNCKEAARLVSEGMDRKLGLGERLSLGLHLALCRGCRHFRRQADFLRTACRYHPSGATRPEEK